MILWSNPKKKLSQGWNFFLVFLGLANLIHVCSSTTPPFGVILPLASIFLVFWYVYSLLVCKDLSIYVGIEFHVHQFVENNIGNSVKLSNGLEVPYHLFPGLCCQNKSYVILQSLCLVDFGLLAWPMLPFKRRVVLQVLWKTNGYCCSGTCMLSLKVSLKLSTLLRATMVCSTLSPAKLSAL